MHPMSDAGYVYKLMHVFLFINNSDYKLYSNDDAQFGMSAMIYKDERCTLYKHMYVQPSFIYYLMSVLANYIQNEIN